MPIPLALSRLNIDPKNAIEIKINVMIHPTTIIIKPTTWSSNNSIGIPVPTKNANSKLIKSPKLNPENYFFREFNSISIKSGIEPICYICKEKFTYFWCEDLDEWIYRDIAQKGDLYYHKYCADCADSADCV